MKLFRRDKGSTESDAIGTKAGAGSGCDHPVSYQEMVLANASDPNGGKVLKCMNCGEVLAGQKDSSAA